jgi:Protein of unknown function (DUF4232)
MKIALRIAVVGVALTGAVTTLSVPISASVSPPPVCSLNAGLKAAMRTSGAGGMHFFFFLVFVNSGNRSCSLEGLPGVQPVIGQGHARVGGDSRHTTPPAPREVVLRAHGGAAHADFSAWDVSALGIRRCKPHPTDGVMVHIKGVQAFYLHAPMGDIAVCSVLGSSLPAHSTAVGAISKGAN